MAFSARLTDTGLGLRAEVDTNTSQLAQITNTLTIEDELWEVA